LCSRGFTVPEILVTVAILALGILVLTKMQVLSVKGTGFNKEATVATALAQRVMEDCKIAEFGTKPSSCETTDGRMMVACSTRISGNAPYRSNDITVKVSWGAPEKQISLSTTIAER
jgi:prepilin-type N-terminal cleavage/methylation domain-containing protein